MFSICFVVKYLSVSRIHGAVGWSAVCDCGSSWTYSLTGCYFHHHNFKFLFVYLTTKET